MRRATWTTALTLLAFTQPSADAQVTKADVRDDRRAARLMDQLREEMWTYRKDLDFFQKAPEYAQLVDLRHQLRGLAIAVAESPDSAQRQRRDLSRQMDEAAKKLYRLSNQLEERIDLGNRQDVRQRANALEERAVEIRVLIGRLQEAVR